MYKRLIAVLPIAGVCAAQTATISGIVTDARTHLPIQGVAVTANQAVIRTDINGRYVLSVPAAESVHLAASRTGFVAITDPLPFHAGETLQRNFELRPLLKISGAVEDHDTGEPIHGCQVFALRRIYALGRAWHVPAGLVTADTRAGRFEIRNLEPGDYVLEIVPEDAAPVLASAEKPGASRKFHGWSYYPDASRIEMAAPITVTEAGDVPVTIRLHRREPRSVSGALTLPASVELIRYAEDDVRTVASGTLSTAGPFRIDNLPPGDYHLVAHAAAGMLADIPVTIGDVDITGLRIAPVRARTVAGTVRMHDGGKLPPKLRFGFTPMRPFRTVSTEKEVPVVDGRFQITADPDEYVVRIKGLPVGYIATQENPASLDYVIDQAGRLTGTVKDEYILLPGGTTLTGEFALDLAPGNYQIAKLEGDEPKLVHNKEFLTAKSAQSLTTIEIRSGEATTFRP